MTIDREKLKNLRALAQALDTQLEDQKVLLDRGMIDIATYGRLNIDYNRQRNVILQTIKEAVAGTDSRIDDVLDGAIGGTTDPDEAADTLRQVAADRGLGTRIVEAIGKNRGTIITWVVDLALEIGKQIV